jgi:hypothetical protein
LENTNSLISKLSIELRESKQYNTDPRIDV